MLLLLPSSYPAPTHSCSYSYSYSCSCSHCCYMSCVCSKSILRIVYVVAVNGKTLIFMINVFAKMSHLQKHLVSIGSLMHNNASLLTRKLIIYYHIDIKSIFDFILDVTTSSLFSPFLLFILIMYF